MQARSKAHCRTGRDLFRSVLLILAISCLAGVNLAVDQALRHTNLDLLLSAVRGRGFIYWMIVSYCLTALAASMATWAVTTCRNRK